MGECLPSGTCGLYAHRLLWYSRFILRRIWQLAKVIGRKKELSNAAEVLSGFRGLAPYSNEVRELVWSLLQRLDELERLSKSWQEHSQRADAEVARAPNHNVATLNEASAAQIAVQDDLFNEFDAFLAAFARQSLLFFPQIRKGDPDADFKEQRSEKLRTIFKVQTDGTLADREVRNAWMHFDERLDSAISNRQFGDRQRFVFSAKADDHKQSTLRLFVVDTLNVCFRTQSGEVRCVDIRALRPDLMDLFEHAKTALQDAI